MTPSDLSVSHSSAWDRYSRTPNFSATSAAAGPGSPMDASCASLLASTSSMCRWPIRPAPATAIRTGVVMLGFLLREFVETVDGQGVAEDPEAHDDAAGDGRDVAVVPELLTLVHVPDVALDHRQLRAFYRVVQRDRGVGVRAGVADRTDRVPGLDRGPELVDPVDELALVVGLPERQLQVQPVALGLAHLLHVDQ